jgi:hypothetical protein
MVAGKNFMPAQGADTGAGPSATSRLGRQASKYVLNDGTVLDTTFTIAQGPLIFPGVNRSYIETWTIFFNEPLQNLMSFPIAYSKDVDAGVPDAFSNELSFQSAVLKNINNPFVAAGAAANAQQYILKLTQEFCTTGSWNPFVGFAITSNSIPAQFETMGYTAVTAGSSPLPQIGNVTHPVLFDYDFHATTAHDILQGVWYNPNILRWAGMSGGPIADIGFFIYLKTRDGSYVPWNLPAEAMIDIKFAFSRSHAGL